MEILMQSNNLNFKVGMILILIVGINLPWTEVRAQDSGVNIDYSFGIEGSDLPVRLRAFGTGEIIRMDSRICLERLNAAVDELKTELENEDKYSVVEVFPQVHEGRITQLNVRIGDGKGNYSQRRTIDLLEGNLCNRLGPDFLVNQVNQISSEWIGPEASTVVDQNTSGGNDT